MNLGPEVNSSAHDRDPSVSADGLKLCFSSNRGGGHGGYDIYVATRERTHNGLGEAIPFGDIQNLGPIVNSPANDGTPSLSADGLSLYFNSSRPGGHGRKDLYVATRETVDDDFEDVVNLGPPVNTVVHEGMGSISADGLTLVWSDTHGGTEGPFRPGGFGFADIWTATRERTHDELGNAVPFGNVRNLGWPASSSGYDCCPELSADWPAPGSAIYYTRCFSFENCQLYVATWHPDCNDNGIDDRSEIADGDAEDVNTNDVPDDCEGEAVAPFLRGDCNADDTVNVSDATCALDWLFAGAAAPGCLAALNANGDDKVDLADPVYLLNFLFGGGPAVPAPFPECSPGTLPADGDLGCARPSC